MTRLLGVDPGAIRLGWCVLESQDKAITILGYGVQGVQREKAEPYQEYRLRLIDFWVQEAQVLHKTFEPDTLISEIIPVVSNSNFVIATQSQLAATAITTIQAIMKQNGSRLEQISALKVKRAIGGKKDATKVAVRNGIYKVLPEAKVYDTEFKASPDLSDAFGVCLAGLGLKNNG